jgi:hypothetical protein
MADVASALGYALPILQHLQGLRSPQSSRLNELSERLRRSANGLKKKQKQKHAKKKESDTSLRICDPFSKSPTWRELRRLGFSGAVDGKSLASVASGSVDVVCSCPPAAALEAVAKVLPHWQTSGCPFMLLLPAKFAAEPLWKKLLSQQIRLAESMFYVVPPIGSKIWFVGGWGDFKATKAAKGAAIHDAVGRKSSGDEFCKIADTVERLEELGCLHGEGGAEGTTKCRIDYLFSKTPESVRQELHLDQTATFSGIDTQTAQPCS